MKDYLIKRSKFSKRLIVLSLFLIISIIFFIIPDNKNNKKFPTNQIFTNNQNNTEKICPYHFKWEIGTRQMYDFDLNTEVTIDYSVLPQIENSTISKKKISASIKGILNFRIFDMPSDWENVNWDEAVIAGFQLSPVQVTIAQEHGVEGKRAPELEITYETFFVVIFTNEGLPAFFYFPEEVDEEDRITLSEIVNSVQLYIPVEKVSKKWSNTENHANGSFQVEYLNNDIDCGSIYKETVKCLSLQNNIFKPEDDYNLKGYIIESGYKGGLSPENSWITSFYGSETFEIRVDNGAPWYVSRNGVIMKLKEFQPHMTLAIWSETENAKEIIDNFIFLGKDNQRTIWGNKKKVKQLEKISLVQLLEDIKDESGPMSDPIAGSEKLVAYIDNLKDFLIKYPEETTLIPDYIKNLRIKGDAVAKIILTMEILGTKQSQQALESIMTDQNQENDTRFKAVIAAGGVDHPEGNIMKSLFNLYDLEHDKRNSDSQILANASLLSLGFISNKFFINNNETQAKIINNTIINYLNSSDDENEQTICIKALGNTSNPLIQTALIPYINSESESIRKSVFEALENLPFDTLSDDPINLQEDESDENEDEKLFEESEFTAQTDESITSHAQTITPSEIAPLESPLTKADNNKTITIIELLIDSVEKEEDTDIRKAAIKALINGSDSNEVFDFFQEFIDIETDEDNKLIIRIYLEKYTNDLG